VDGLAEAIIPVLPLKLDNRELYLDQSAFDATNNALATLTARVANDEALIAANAAAIVSNTNAITANAAANIAAIVNLQQQLTALSQQLRDLAGSIKASALNPYGDASLVGAGVLVARLGHYANIYNLSAFMGAGALSVDLNKVPKVLAPGNVAGAGNLTALLAAMARMVAPLTGAGRLQVDALVKSLVLKQGDVPLFGTGSLSTALVAMQQAQAALAGAGAMTTNVGMQLAAATAFGGAGGATMPTLRKLLLPGTFAGAGALPAVTATVQGFSTLDPATLPAGEALSNGNRTVTGTSYPTPYGSARGTKSQSSGLRYFEVTFNSQGVASAAVTGVANGSFTLANNSPGADANGWGVGATPSGGNNEMFNSVEKGYLGSTANGDVAMVAVNFTTGGIWFGINNNWCNGAGGPAGSGGDYTFTPGTTLWPVVCAPKYVSTATTVATFNPGNSAFAFSLPSGFTAWS
jgi:hypothetical protein